MVIVISVHMLQRNFATILKILAFFPSRFVTLFYIFVFFFVVGFT